MAMRKTSCSIDYLEKKEEAIILGMRSAKPEWQKSQASFIRNFLLERENNDHNEETTGRSLDVDDTYVLRQKYLRSYQFTRADDDDSDDEGRNGGGKKKNKDRALKKIVKSIVARRSDEKKIEQIRGKGGKAKLKNPMVTCFKLFLLL